MKKDVPFTTPQDLLHELQEKEKELNKFIDNLENTNKNKNREDPEYHVNRLLNESLINPYDVLELPPECNDFELKQKYKQLSLLVHPDKCSHEKAADAFNMVDKAYKTLKDPEKRQIYIRIMREARERVEYERSKENDKRKKEGKQLLPEDTFNIDVQNMVTKLFQQIEDNKDYYDKVDQIKKKRMHKEVERRKLMKEIEKEDEKSWEENRDKRVKQWRNFEKSHRVRYLNSTLVINFLKADEGKFF